jgi:hypothetical protein
MAQTDLFQKVDNGAAFSDCRKYRYALWRIWDESKPLVMFIGLNPSKADESETDNTITTVKSFAKNWGFGGFYMMNCFPYVSTNPDDLKDFGNTVENDFWLYYAEKRVAEIIFAWGAFKIVKKSRRDVELSAMFPNAKCLIKNKDGSPHHPLYLSLKTKPIIFKPIDATLTPLTK